MDNHKKKLKQKSTGSNLSVVTMAMSTVSSKDMRSHDKHKDTTENYKKKLKLNSTTTGSKLSLKTMATSTVSPKEIRSSDNDTIKNGQKMLKIKQNSTSNNLFENYKKMLKKKSADSMLTMATSTVSPHSNHLTSSTKEVRSSDKDTIQNGQKMLKIKENSTGSTLFENYKKMLKHKSADSILAMAMSTVSPKEVSSYILQTIIVDGNCVCCVIKYRILSTEYPLTNNVV